MWTSCPRRFAGIHYSRVTLAIGLARWCPAHVRPHSSSPSPAGRGPLTLATRAGARSLGYVCQSLRAARRALRQPHRAHRRSRVASVARRAAPATTPTAALRSLTRGARIPASPSTARPPPFHSRRPVRKRRRASRWSSGRLPSSTRSPTAPAASARGARVGPACTASSGTATCSPPPRRLRRSSRPPSSARAKRRRSRGRRRRAAPIRFGSRQTSQTQTRRASSRRCPRARSRARASPRRSRSTWTRPGTWSAWATRWPAAVATASARPTRGR